MICESFRGKEGLFLTKTSKFEGKGKKGLHKSHVHLNLIYREAPECSNRDCKPQESKLTLLRAQRSVTQGSAVAQDRGTVNESELHTSK